MSGAQPNFCLNLRSALASVANAALLMRTRHQRSEKSLGDAAGGYQRLFEQLATLRKGVMGVAFDERIDDETREEILAAIDRIENSARRESLGTTAKIVAVQRLEFIDALQWLERECDAARAALQENAPTPMSSDDDGIAGLAHEPSPAAAPIEGRAAKAGLLIEESLLLPMLDTLELLDCLHELASIGDDANEQVLTRAHLRAAIRPLLTLLEKLDAQQADAYGLYVKVQA